MLAMNWVTRSARSGSRVMRLNSIAHQGAFNASLRRGGGLNSQHEADAAFHSGSTAAHSLAQSPSATAPNSVGVPKPIVDPTAGTWKYKGRDVKAGSTYLFTYSTTVKDDGGMWTVVTAWEFPNLGPVTDVLTLEKGTLIPRKESFKHFAKPGARGW
jgi:hypothetical protein